MAIDETSNQAQPPNLALTEWQRVLTDDPSPRSAQLSAVAEDDTGLAPDGLLACGLCYRSFPPEKLAVASKERFNWDSSVVVCPECLTELKLETRARSKGPDLMLGVVWAVIGLIITTIPLALTSWTMQANPNYDFWQWLGCYFAFVPGFIIGRLVRYGVGRRHSLEQQLIAMFFTFGVVLLTSYVGWVADNNNFYNVVTHTTDHVLVLPSVTEFFFERFVPAITDYGSLQRIWSRLGILVGIVVGLTVAYFSSEGLRVYSRPFVSKRR